MPSSLSTILCIAAICAAILGSVVGVVALVVLAFFYEFILSWVAIERGITGGGGVE